jgi:hypothetical protein
MANIDPPKRSDATTTTRIHVELLDMIRTITSRPDLSGEADSVADFLDDHLMKTVLPLYQKVTAALAKEAEQRAKKYGIKKDS